MAAGRPRRRRGAGRPDHPDQARHLVRAPARRDRARPEPVHDGDGIEIPQLGGERRPIVPRSPAVAARHLEGDPASTSTRPGSTSRSTRCARRSTWRSASCWAVVGTGKIARTQCQWWWVTEQARLRSKAVIDGNAAGVAQAAFRRGPPTQLPRLRARSASWWRSRSCLVLIAAFAPWWAWLIVAAVAMPPLAHHGHPAPPADRAVRGDDAAGAEDQHRRDRPRVRAGRAVLAPTRRSQPTSSGSGRS